MTDVELRQENASLREVNTKLSWQLGDAQQALDALSRGEVDAVALESVGTPLLLHAAQRAAHRESAERLRMAQQLRIIAEASRGFSSATADYPRLLEAVARTLSEAVGATCVIYLLSADGGTLDAVAAHDSDPVRLHEARTAATRYQVADHPELAATLAGRTWSDPVAAREPLPRTWAAHAEATEAHAGWWLPLCLRERPLGILALRRAGADARPFDDRDRELAQILADHAALAIGNASSYAAECVARTAAERATHALRSAEGRFSRLSESGLLGIFVRDHGGRVDEVNDTLLAMLGYARDELLSGRVPWDELTPPEWRPGNALAIEQLTTVGVTGLREQEYLRKDGTRVAVLVGSALIEGETTKSISFVLDLTERKLAQAVISRLHQDRAVDAKFRELLESAADAIVAVGDNGTVVLVNGQFEKLFGYAREEIMGRPIDVLVPDRMRGAQGWLVASYFRNPGARQLGERRELCARRKDGTELEIEVSLSSVATSAGLLVSGSIRDITDRKKVEDQRARLAAIVDSSDDAIIGKTLDGRITSWNRGAERTFGYTADEVVGTSGALLVPLDQSNKEREIVEAAACGTVQHVDTTRRTRSGRAVEVSLTISPVHDVSGRVAGTSEVARDITERKRNEVVLLDALDAAVAANHELETFSYSVAHDLRSPLRGMSAFAELLLGTYDDKLDAEGRDWLRKIVACATRMGALIDALLALSRVARNEVAREPVDLSAIVRGSYARLMVTDAQRTAELVLEDDLWAYLDPGLALALVDNLLSNAVKFTSKVAAPRIEFGAVERDGARAFFVRDNGTGFDMRFADKLFVPFQRLHSGDEFPGRGIGLATVQRIVHRHGGTICGEGAIDGGATFYVTLPPGPDGAR